MNQEVTEESGMLGQEPEICIWIDKYDDVFSEFDSRPFSDRALSDDFLREVRKMTSEKSKGEIRLKFHVMDDQRNPESESIILNNLNKHFRHIADELKVEQRETLKRGYLFMGFGSLLILGIFFLTTISETAKYLDGIILLLEPVGWFTTWTGLDYVFQISRKEKSSIDFNSKMAQAKIAFSSFDAAQDATGSRQKTVIPLDNQNLRVA